MAGFRDAEWERIFERLDDNEQNYGPPARRRRSVVLASWNIRKLGRLKRKSGSSVRSSNAWEHRFCVRCDFVAIQEVQDSLARV